MSAPRFCVCCERPLRNSSMRKVLAPGTVPHAGGGRCKPCRTHGSLCDLVRIELCRWVGVDGEWRPVLVSGIRRGRRNRGPYRVQVDGVIREYPRELWTEVIA